jgi:hypothetical protein
LALVGEEIRMSTHFDSIIVAEQYVYAKELLNALSPFARERCSTAFEQFGQGKEPHLLPAKHLAVWIQTNL